jgi:phosphoglycerate dehydrogenase-like enzyme
MTQSQGDDALSIVSLVPLSPRAIERIEAIDPSISVTVAAGWFDDEIRAGWGSHTADGYLPPASGDVPPQAERGAALAGADVVLGGFPVLLDLRARAPRMRWFHQTPAGASNLLRCDLWGSDVVVSTGRGLGNTTAIAEYTLAAFMHFARDLHRAEPARNPDALDRTTYRPVGVAGKQVCVVGAGGIGQEVGRLCAAVGMKVVGTRTTAMEVPPEGFDLVTGGERLHELLADSTFVAVCCQWTPATEGLIGADALAAMPDDAVLVNVARGEIIDEDALVAELDRLRGVALDVYIGEFEHEPPAALWNHPNVLITPHTSAGSESRSRRPIDLFCDNLAAFVAHETLDNVIDWARGY